MAQVSGRSEGKVGLVQGGGRGETAGGVLQGCACAGRPPGLQCAAWGGTGGAGRPEGEPPHRT